MKDKKEFLKKYIIIIIIILFGVCGFIFYKTSVDSFYEFEEIDSNNSLYENRIAENEEISEVKENAEEIEKIKVYITGEVNSPGVKELDVGARIEDAINIAGGITNFANLKEVNLAYPLEDGQKIYIPNINEKIDEYITANNGEGVIENIKDKNARKININNADLQQLCNLPGVGESLAQKIIEYRNDNGKFESVDELKNVTGIGEKKYESLKEYITVK